MRSRDHREREEEPREPSSRQPPSPAGPVPHGPAEVLALQASAGNQAVSRALAGGRRPAGGALARAPAAATAAQPTGPELGEHDIEFMGRDVDRIVELLKEQILSAREESEIVGIIRHYAEIDRRHNDDGHPGTINLDRLLLMLKTRVFTRRTARSGWIEQHLIAYDTLWHELEDDRLTEFRALVARSAKHGTAGPSAGPSENLWATLGKQEAMGVWGILKGMGLTLSGVADAAVWAAWRQGGQPLYLVLEQMGVKDAAKAPAISPYLSKSYDEVAKLMGDAFGIDPAKDETLFGQSSYEIGEFGGKIVGALTTAGAAAGGAGAQAAQVAKTMAVIGSLKSIEESADAIAKRLAELRKRKPPPSLEQLLFDEAVMVELASILGNALGAASGAGDAAPALKAAFDRFGLIVDAAQLVPAVGKAFMHWNDPALAKDPEARAAALRDDVAGIVGTVLSTAGTKGQEALDKRAADQKAAQNRAFDERWNPHLLEPPAAAGAEPQTPAAAAQAAGAEPQTPAAAAQAAGAESQTPAAAAGTEGAADPAWAGRREAMDVPAIQVGHRTSKHTGEQSFFAVEDADFNQQTGQGPERGGGYTVKETVLIGGVPVDLESALRWSGPETSELTGLTREMVQNAPRSDGWPAPPGIQDKSAMQQFSRRMLDTIGSDPAHPLRFLLKERWPD